MTLESWQFLRPGLVIHCFRFAANRDFDVKSPRSLRIELRLASVQESGGLLADAETSLCAPEELPLSKWVSQAGRGGRERRWGRVGPTPAVPAQSFHKAALTRSQPDLGKEATFGEHCLLRPGLAVRLGLKCFC